MNKQCSIDTIGKTGPELHGRDDNLQFVHGMIILGQKTPNMHLCIVPYTRDGLGAQNDTENTWYNHTQHTDARNAEPNSYTSSTQKPSAVVSL